MATVLGESFTIFDFGEPPPKRPTKEMCGAGGAHCFLRSLELRYRKNNLDRDVLEAIGASHEGHGDFCCYCKRKRARQ